MDTTASAVTKTACIIARNYYYSLQCIPDGNRVIVLIGSHQMNKNALYNFAASVADSHLSKQASKLMGVN